MKMQRSVVCTFARIKYAVFLFKVHQNNLGLTLDGNLFDR